MISPISSHRSAIQKENALPLSKFTRDSPQKTQQSTSQRGLVLTTGGFQNSLNMFAHAKALKYNMLTAKP